jgi:hypothetical protein
MDAWGLGDGLISFVGMGLEVANALSLGKS